MQNGAKTQLAYFQRFEKAFLAGGFPEREKLSRICKI
jgi:hypothetical protein